MSSATANFRIGLYREHLAEASALYDLRHALLADPDREWRSLLDFEERLEAHIDALVIGGSLALEVCAETMREGDAGELFASLCVCCRHGDATRVAAMWHELDFADQERVRAVTESLKFELPAAWAVASEQANAREDAGRLAVLAIATAYRRLPLGSQFAAYLESYHDSLNSDVVRALALARGVEAVPVLRKCLRSNNPDVRAAALRGLLVAGDERSLQDCYVYATTEDWAHLALGLSGDRQAATILSRTLEAGRGSQKTVLALGLLGELSTIRSLTFLLESEPIAETAALALHWITGAELYENVFIPDPVDESELFERELEVWRETGVAPRRADGRPYGSDVRRLSRQAPVWHQWLTDHAGEFDANLRYRRGELYGPRQLLDCLLAPVAPMEWRQLAYEELVIRYGCPEPFEADAFAVDQFACLRRIGRWVKDNEMRFEASRGTFQRGGAL